MYAFGMEYGLLKYGFKPGSSSSLIGSPLKWPWVPWNKGKKFCSIALNLFLSLNDKCVCASAISLMSAALYSAFLIATFASSLLRFRFSQN
jgi:hypothetical protein